MWQKLLKWGIFTIVFCLPLYLVRFKILNIPTTLLEILIYFLVIVWLLGGVNIDELKTKIKENRLLFWAIFCILFGASLATFYSWDLRTSLGIWKAWFIDPVLFFFVFIVAIKSLKDLEKIFYVLFASGFFVSFIALIYLLLGRFNPDHRLEAFYSSPNYLAMYLTPIMAMMFCYGFLGLFIKANSGSKESVLLIAVSGFILLVLIFTKSFGAWMGIVIAIGLDLVLWLRTIKKQKIALFLIILLVILSIGILTLKFNSVQGRLSIASRLEIWQKAIEAIWIYPVIGIGPGTFKDFFPEYPLWGVPQPHNLYLAFLLQTGIIGFIGFILLMFWFFRHPLCRINKINLFQFSIFAAMFSVLAHGIFDTTYWKNDLALMFWIFIGMMAVINTESKIKHQNTI